MQASTVPIRATALELAVQGFRGNEELGIKPYVFVAVNDGGEFSPFEGELTPENAHILSEEIRKHAEWALSQ